MRFLLTGVLLIAVASKLSESQQQECDIPGLDSYVARKENASTAVLANVQTIATSVVPGLSNELGDGSANSSDLYNALTTTLNVTNNSSFVSFAEALGEITDAYFLACYGEQNQQPTRDDLVPALQNLLMLLDTLSADNADEELPMIREYFGEISCLIDTYGYDNLLPTDSGPTEPDSGTSPPTSPSGKLNCSDLASITVEAFYACIGPNDIQPIFGIGPEVNLYNQNNQLTVVSKRCVGFVVDTTGSMGSEISEVRSNIKSFIASEKNLPACYVLVDFNDNGAPSPSDNVNLVRVYDPNIGYKSDGSNLVRTGDLPVYGVQELYADVDNLYAHGGGDCPEYGMAGILKALEAISSVEGLVLPEQGNLHHVITLTDASPKDDFYFQEVIEAASDARATLHFFYSGGGCSGSFGNYETVRIATGGLDVDNFADFDALAEFIQLYNEAVEASSGLVSRRKRSPVDIFSEPASSHSVYVNYLTDNLAILAQTEESQVTVENPNGQVELLPVSGILALYTDDDPIPGLWTISVSLGVLQVVVSAPILLQLDITYTTTNENGEIVPTKDIPYACETGTIFVTSPQLSSISLNYSLYLNLLDSTGNLLEQAELRQCSGSLTAVVTFPGSPLVFYQLQGHDIGENPFSKTLSDNDVTFRPPTLKASLLNSYDITVNPGNTSFSKVELHYNQSYGADLNLEFTVTSSSSDLVTYYVDVPQSVKVGEKVYAVFETQASVNVLPGASGYYVTANITESCTGSTLSFTIQVISHQPVPLAVSNTTQSDNDRNLRVSWQKPNVSAADAIWQYRLHLDYDNSTLRQVDVDSTVREYTLDGLQPYQQVYVVVEARSAANETLAKTAQFRFRSREDVPGPAARVTYTAADSNTALVQWDPPTVPNGVILYYVVRLLDVADARELNSSYVDALKERTITFQHLEEYVRYEAAVIGATSEGLGASQQTQFYTREGEPQGFPQNIRIRPITTTSANISWDPPPVRSRRGFITRYDVTIGYNEPSGQHRVRYFYTLKEDNTSVKVEDLPQYGRVTAEVSCATEKGDGPVSPPTTGVIELPPSAPLSLIGRPVGSSSVALKWLPPENLNGVLLGYSVFFRTEDSANQTEQEFQELRINLYQLEDVNSPDAQVDGLTSPAAHSFYVTAFNSAGNGQNSTQISVTLDDSTWIIILCGVMAIVVIITLLVICIIVLCCVLMKRRRKSEKQGVFEVFRNEEDVEEKSATNPVFEPGQSDHIYEEMDKVQEEARIHAMPSHSPTKRMVGFEEFHNKCDPVDESATNPVFELGHADDGYTDLDQLIDKEKPEMFYEQETESELEREQELTKVPEKETDSKHEKERKMRKIPQKEESESELEKMRKLRKVPEKKTEAQIQRERRLKTVPDKIDHYEDIITKLGGTGALGQTTAAFQATNTAAYVSTDGNVVVSLSTHQSQQQ